MSANWKDIKIEGIVRIDKLVEEYDISLFHAHARFRVYEKPDGQYYALSSIRIKDKKTGDFIMPTADGDTSEEALKNAVLRGIDMVLELNEELSLSDNNYVRSEYYEY